MNNKITEKLSDKDGVVVYRTTAGVLKVFANETGQQEMRFYDILREYGVPTLRVLARTESSLLLEDLAISLEWRLGRPEDMDDPTLARGIAAWYSTLHTAGRRYPGLYDLPAETDKLAEANMRLLAKAFPCKAFWPKLLANYDKLRQTLDALPQTLVYNDFYCSNLAVARNSVAALMFDYNMAGRGYAYGDLRNVTYSLSERAARAFREVYGEVDPREQAVDAVACDLIALWNAAQRTALPRWAEPILGRLRDGTLLRNLEEFIGEPP